MTFTPVSKNCPECGEIVEIRYTRVGYTMVVPAFEVKRGPQHARRCPHWRSEIQDSK